MLMLGVTPYDMLLQGVGAKADPASGGRQMPSHWGNRDLTLSRAPRPLARNFCRPSARRNVPRISKNFPSFDRARKAPMGATASFHADEIVYVSAGDGTTSEGEFYESLNTACGKRLPVLYLIEDNGYAISVPVEVQTPGGSISKLVRNYPEPVRRGMRRHGASG